TTRGRKCHPTGRRNGQTLTARAACLLEGMSPCGRRLVIGPSLFCVPIRKRVMNGRIPPALFFVILAALCLLAGVPLSRPATAPLCHGGVPEAPAESQGRIPFRFTLPTAARAVGTTPTVPFVDVAGSSGLRYEWTIPGKRPLNILQTIGNGCAFLD